MALPLQQLLSRFEALPVQDKEAEVGALEQTLSAQLRSPSEDAPLLFAAAFEALRHLPDERPTASRACALRAIAIHYFSNATPQAGIEPALESVRVARLVQDSDTLLKALKILGVIYAESGNLPGATEAYSEALDLATSSGAVAQQCALWNNIGLVHLYACQYADAIACFERALEIGADRPGTGPDLSIARSNIAIASLYCGDIAKGLRAALASIAANGEPGDSIVAMARTDLESYTTRLLLETGDIAGAQSHAARATHFATIARSPRAEIMAEIAFGLTEVHAGTHDLGLARLKRTLARARDAQSAMLPDALVAAIKGYEVAGQPDVALVYLRELVRWRGDARRAQILMHHTQHLASLDRGIDDQAVLKIEQHQAELRGRLSDREVLKARIAMLEQNAVAGELHDDTTGEHCYRVGRLASLLAQEYGVDEDTCFLIDLAARLHDIPES
jgi:putative two-component system response regulator